VKARVLRFEEIEDKFKATLVELAREPRDTERVVELGVELLFALGVCISQTKAPSGSTYAGKSEHLKILERAAAGITFKLNACTVEQVETQVPAAYRAFGLH
jgi:hypothetical protein